MDRLLVSLKYGSVEIVSRDRNLTQACKPPLIRGDRISCTLWKSSHPCVLGLSLDGWSKTLLRRGWRADMPFDKIVGEAMVKAVEECAAFLAGR